LTIGRTGNTANVTVSAAQSVAGPISIFGGNLTINAGLAATGANTITLQSIGTVTQTAALTANSLALLGSGSFTLTNSSNNTSTLAASGVGSLSYVNSNALTLGTVGTTNGVAATGAVNIGTTAGDLTVAQNVGTTNATASALVLNAGIGAAAGIATGGNIVISGSPAISTGTNGRATLYSGSISGSTGLTALVGSGSGRFRYNSDEAFAGFNTSTAAMGSGLFGIYRERPTATISSMTLSMTYGDSLPSISATGLVNGDGSDYTITSRANATSGNISSSGTPYAISSNLGGLGYNLTGPSSGTLAVSQKALTLSGFAANASKVYDGTTTATISNAGSLLGVITSDLVSVSNGGATFDNPNAGTGKTVTLNGVALAGADSANYSVASTATNTANVTAKQLTLTSSKVYDGTTDLAGAVTLGGFVLSETLTYSGATASDAHVATAGKFINAITLGNGAAGGVVGNYQLPTLNAANAPVTNTPATLTATLSNTGVTKTYDGTTNAPASFAPTYTFTGFVSGDTAAALGNTSNAYNSKDVLTANKVTVSGLSVNGIAGGNSSQASDYVLDATSKEVVASISQAALTVRANNDADLFTQQDSRSGSNYQGEGYTGLVGGETSAVLTGTLAVTRDNIGTSGAGTYANVLTPAGLTSSNYAIAFAKGSYTIVPANQLLVNVTSQTLAYGAAPTYTVTSARYLASDNSTINTPTVTDNGSNSFTVDGVTFTLAAAGAVNSSAGATVVGNYQLAGAVTTGNSGNFSNTLVATGALQVNQASLTPTATGVSKVYDGNTSMNGVSLGLTGKLAADVVTVSGIGAFGSANVSRDGSNNMLADKIYSISNLALGGADAGNYFWSGGSSLSGTDGQITPKTLTVTYGGVNKVYDGTVAATVTNSDDRIAGDAVTINQTAAFADKNVGSGKAVSISGVSLGGADQGNYTLASTTGSTTADIARLNSVTWIGGPTGNWFDPANWAGGAVPDLSNVANVVIPLGVVVSFDTTGAVAPANSGAPVNVESLGNAGSLTQNSGTLNVGTGGILLASLTQTGGTLGNVGTTVVDSFAQDGGSFSGTGAMTAGQFSQTGGATTLGSDLTVTQGFSQGSSGSVSVGGNAQITDTSGGVQLGNLTSSGTLAVNSTDGGITQAVGTAITALSTSNFTATQGGNPADVTLANAGNDFTGAVSLSGAAVQIADTNALTLGTVTTTGDLTVNSTGALNLGTTSVGGGLNANSGNGDVSQSGPLAVNGSTTLAAGTGDITLSNLANDFGGTVNAAGADIALADANALTLGNVTASGNLDATAGTDIALNGTVNAASLDLQATNGSISQGTSNTLTVTNGPTNLGAAGNINLSNPGNDFNGTVNAAGTDISLADANALTLGSVVASGNLSLQSSGNLDMGTTTVGGALNANSGNGDITQTGSLNVAGLATLQAGNGAVVLNNPGNRLLQGVVVTAASSSITGDAQGGSQTAVEQVIGATPVVPMLGVSVFDQALPPPLVMALADGTAPAGGATGVTRPGNSAGVIVALADQPSADGLLLVAVSVRGGTAETGFGFVLPASVRDLLAAGVQARASLPDGSPLPAWLRFDPLTLRFEASAAPVGTMPIELLMTLGAERVRLVISERKG